ncbi:MAG: preprotein translocase subunit Sec61beta [Candidatus Helarchaeota archaeon]|nr:preprotein translocase subunit Sec61beta [Candidatus Helarchaeota archaeon]
MKLCQRKNQNARDVAVEKDRFYLYRLSNGKPFAGAGLIRFFEEESSGVKVGPVATIVLALILIIGVAVGLAIS